MKQQLKNAYGWCRRYITLPLIVVVGFIVFVAFFNDNSYLKNAELQDEINRLHAEIKENTDTMRYYRDLNSRLSSDPTTLERIVREQYHMQRADEDVYIFDN
jgi:cell division protein FtsB